MRVLFFCWVPFLAGAASRGQERAPVPGDATRLVVAEIEAHPDRFDPHLLDRLARDHTSGALQELVRLYSIIPDGERRAAVLGQLGGFARTPLAAEALQFLSVTLVAEEDPELVRAAVQNIGAFPGAPELLRSLLDQVQGPGRCFVLHALLLHADPQDRALFAAVARGDEVLRMVRAGLPLGESRWQQEVTALRCEAVRALARDASATGLLESLLDDRDASLEAAALDALGPRNARAVARARALLAETWPLSLYLKAMDTMRREGGHAAADFLLQLARNSRGEVKSYASRCLASMDAAVVLPLLVPLLQATGAAGDAFLALDVLAASPSSTATMVELRGLEHPDPLVRAAVLRDLGRRGDASVRDSVARALKSPEPEVKAEAMVSLSRLGVRDPAWLQEVLRATRAGPLQLRLAAVESLGWLQDPAALARLHELLDDEDWHLRLAAVESLEVLRQRESIPWLIDSLARDRLRLCSSIAATLRALTGMPFATSPRDWQRWWADVGATFQLPSLEEAARSAAVVRSGVSGNTVATFYGIPVLSDHLTLVIDLSGSMAEPLPGSTGPPFPTKLDVAKEEIRSLLERLPDDTHLNLVFFNATPRSWRRSLVTLNPRVRLEAHSFVRGRSAEGATNFFGAMKLALQDPQVDSLYVLSDGEPTVGELIDPLAIREELRRLNPGGQVVVHSVSIGHDSSLLRHLAEDSHGQSIRR